MKDLTKLLYRKKMLEVSMNKNGKGADVYSKLHKAIEDELNERSDLSELDYNRLEAEKMDVGFKASQYISSFKESKRLYENDIIPSIEDIVSDKDKESIEFIDCEKKAESLKQNEMYGNISVKAENVQHLDVIKNFKDSISNLDKLIELTSKEIEKTKGLEKALLEKNLFNYKLEIVNKQKRLNKRVDYYENQFLPTYNKDMKECDERLESYLDVAKEMINLGVDVKLQFVLNEYEKHKEDDQSLWLFYTALKSRLSSIAKEMRRNKGKFKGSMHLAKKELYN